MRIAQLKQPHPLLTHPLTPPPPDVLSDDAARRLYDTHGAAGMQGRAGAAAGAGNAADAWDEFQPFVRSNKNSRARDASSATAAATAAAQAPPSAAAGSASPGASPSADSGASASGASSASDGEAGGEGGAAPEVRDPMPGDLVEYELPGWVREQLRDGRVKGVGLLVARNQDRGDGRSLPEDQADLCEVEPLRQEEAGSDRWGVWGVCWRWGVGGGRRGCRGCCSHPGHPPYAPCPQSGTHTPIPHIAFAGGSWKCCVPAPPLPAHMRQHAHAPHAALPV